MIVKLEGSEVIQACIEWAEKHHGLKLSGDGSIYYTSAANSPNGKAKLQIEFVVASKADDPYRTAPSTKE